MCVYNMTHIWEPNPLSDFGQSHLCSEFAYFDRQLKVYVEHQKIYVCKFESSLTEIG